MTNDPLSEARYKHFMEMERRKQLLHQAKEVHPEKHKINLKFGWVFVALVALAIPTTLVLLNQTQDYRQSAAPNEDIVKAVNGEGITKNELDEKVRELLGSDYKTSTLAAQTREIAMKELIREHLLQQEARKRGIAVNEKEINEETNSSLDPTVRRGTLYSILNKKVEAKVSTWVEVERAYGYKNTSDKSGVKEITDALEKIEEEAKKSMTLKEAYANLKAKGGINTSIIITEKIVLSEPLTKSSIIKKIITLNKGDVSGVLDIGAGGFMVVKIIDKNQTAYPTFEDWYKTISAGVN